MYENRADLFLNFENNFQDFGPIVWKSENPYCKNSDFEFPTSRACKLMQAKTIEKLGILGVFIILENDFHTIC